MLHVDLDHLYLPAILEVERWSDINVTWETQKWRWQDVAEHSDYLFSLRRLLLASAFAQSMKKWLVHKTTELWRSGSFDEDWSTLQRASDNLPALSQHLVMISRTRIFYLVQLLLLLQLVQPHRIISHFLCISGYDDNLTEARVSRETLLQKINESNTVEDVLVFAEEVIESFKYMD